MVSQLTLIQRVARWLSDRSGLSSVRVVAVGRDDDGLLAVPSGSALDKPWADLAQEFADALEAWRKNPLARRMVGLVTAYVIGEGIALRSHYRPLARYLADFWNHPQNNMGMRQYALCEELSRAGELFIVLHFNQADGMSYVRCLPASSIDRVEWRSGDYEAETRYHERVGLDDPDYPGGRWWNALDPEGIIDAARDDAVGPGVLHFAVNRPVGCLRGESDLASILPWLRRYSRWLEDRVRLNAAVRAFLWIVRVPGNLVAQKQMEYARPPEAGSVLVVDKNSEEWDAVAPKLNANEAQADGRAIRWMVVAGGPGVGLTDMGEAETANLATAAAMGEQRWRFMKQRQAYFGYVLASIGLAAYNRAVALGRVRGTAQTLAAIEVGLPDIAAVDAANAGAGAQSVSQALEGLQRMGFKGPEFRRVAARLVMGFAGETLEEADLAALVAASEDPAPKQPAGQPVQPAAPRPSGPQPGRADWVAVSRVEVPR